MLTLLELAKQSYVAYCIAVENQTFENKPTPAWSALRSGIQAAWLSAAACVKQAGAEVSDDRVMGERAYTAYGDAVAWVNYAGAPLLKWEGMDELRQTAWSEFARYARSHEVIL